MPLLAQTRVIQDACDLDLLVFLHRHPRTLLTSEQLAAFAGYDIKQIAKSLEAFIEAGLLARTQNPMHAARLYLLVLSGPRERGLRTFLELASTRQGRREILAILKGGPPQPGPVTTQEKCRVLEIPGSRRREARYA